jgi:D-xylose transport system substrate-binding protein
MGWPAVLALPKGRWRQEAPPVTGPDARADSIQRIIAGDQHETTYLNVEQEATTAAELAAALATGWTPPTTLVGQTINNGQKDVPADLLQPTAVTISNLKQIVIDSRYLTAAEICTADYAKACVAAGIS